MLPHGLFGIGPFLLVIPFAITAGMLVCLRGALRSGIPWKSILRLQIALTIVAIFGARGFSFLFDELWNPLDPGRTPIVGGWRASGGIFALAVALPFLRARLLPEVSLARYADLLGPTVAVALGVYRVQCVLAGCCGGAACDAFFCPAYAPGTEIWQTQLMAGHIGGATWGARVFPLHLAFMVASLAVGAFLWRRDRQRRFDGEVFLLFLVLHEGSKFALELLREPPSLLLQVSSLLPTALGLAAWLAISGRLRAGAQTPSGP
jgi:phosphatidylglycerol:prolipoprotein diacylglycerol transferase